MPFIGRSTRSTVKMLSLDVGDLVFLRGCLKLYHINCNLSHLHNSHTAQHADHEGYTYGNALTGITKDKYILINKKY